MSPADEHGADTSKAAKGRRTRGLRPQPQPSHLLQHAVAARLLQHAAAAAVEARASAALALCWLRAAMLALTLPRSAPLLLGLIQFGIHEPPLVSLEEVAPLAIRVRTHWMVLRFESADRDVSASFSHA